MITDIRSFEIPSDMRALAQRSVEQAKLAFTNYAKAVREAHSAFDQWVTANQDNAQHLSKKAMGFAEDNMLSAFDFALKVAQAKDLSELMRVQTEFLQWQTQALSEQAKDLGETASQSATDSVKYLSNPAEAA